MSSAGCSGNPSGLCAYESDGEKKARAKLHHVILFICYACIFMIKQPNSHVIFRRHFTCDAWLNPVLLGNEDDMRDQSQKRTTDIKGKRINPLFQAVAFPRCRRKSAAPSADDRGMEGRRSVPYALDLKKRRAYLCHQDRVMDPEAAYESEWFSMHMALNPYVFPGLPEAPSPRSRR